MVVNYRYMFFPPYHLVFATLAGLLTFVWLLHYRTIGSAHLESLLEPLTLKEGIRPMWLSAILFRDLTMVDGIR
jgi:hypothetical protein